MVAPPPPTLESQKKTPYLSEYSSVGMLADESWRVGTGVRLHQPATPAKR
jgi:hypothetical protein